MVYKYTGKEGIILNICTEKKITVVGIGGVGGYIGALLADAYPQVTFVARGKRKDAIETNGLTLHSEYRGERRVHPMRTVVSAAGLPVQDYIFICVKNYSLEEACKSLHGCISPDTVIVPVMNGADPGPRTRGLLSSGIVVDSLIYIIAFAAEDHSIVQQGGFANLYVGVQDAAPGEARAASDVADLLDNAGIDCKTSPDIQTEIWKKYILNCAYNVETAFYNNTIGELRKAPVKAAQYEALTDEAFRVALAKGVRVTEEHKNAIIHRFYHELAEDATSSLQRDVAAGHRTELETFSGYIVREARRLHVDTPVSNAMYEGLKEKIHAASGGACV